MTTIPHQITALRKIFGDANPAELASLFGGTARRVYRLPEAGSAVGVERGEGVRSSTT